MTRHQNYSMPSPETADVYQVNKTLGRPFAISEFRQRAKTFKSLSEKLVIFCQAERHEAATMGPKK